jgi:hypothetical protein
MSVLELSLFFSPSAGKLVISIPSYPYHYFRKYFKSIYRRKCGYGNFNDRCNVSPIHLHTLLGVVDVTKDGWSTCVPTAYEVAGSLRNTDTDELCVG